MTITMADNTVSEDARNKLEDLSGIVLKPGENPYAAFIGACNDKPVSHLPKKHGIAIAVWP